MIGWLDRRWTKRIIVKRIIVLPGEPVITDGSCRLQKDPNDLIVASEIAVVPYALGLPSQAVIFSLANAAMLYHRITVENAALNPAAAGGGYNPDSTPTLANGGARR